MSIFDKFNSRSENFFIILFFFLISSSWALLIKENLLSENFSSAVFYLYFYIYIIIFIEIFIINLLLNINFSKRAKNLAISIIVFFNFYSLSISLTSNFIVLEGADKIKFFLIYFICTLVITQIFLINLRVIKSLIIFYIFFNLYLLLDYKKFFPFKTEKEFDVNLVQKKFIKPANLYVFSIESLVPETLINSHYNLENSKYIRSLKKNSFTIFRNNFSDNFPTSPSLNSLLYIDPVKWRENSNNKLSYFSGRQNLSLFKLLKLNDYKITTGYYDSHFGPPGKYIDEYLTFRSVKDADTYFSKIYINFCQFKLPWYHAQLFNYCDLIKVIFRIQKKDILSSKNKFNSNILKKISNETKKFVFFHFYTFGHPTGETQNYINDFRNGDLETANIIEEAAKRILKDDPKSILILIGDSGPTIFKHSKEETLKKNILMNYPSVDHSNIIDNHATVGSVFDPSGICFHDIEKLRNNIFTTNSMIFNTILSCMLGENNILEDKRKNIKYTLPMNEEFENYLYE